MLHESQFVSISQKHLFLPNNPFEINNRSDKIYSQLPFEPQPLEMMFDNLPVQQAFSQQIIVKPSKFSNLKKLAPPAILPQKRSCHDQQQLKMPNYESQKEPLKSQKGLKHLSIKVKQIVFEFKSTSYKDVAERLIQELIQEEGRISDCDNSKDEQNIKRRVYDALNVMIASRVLKKEGKKVKADFDTLVLGKNILQEKSFQKEQLTTMQKTVELKKKQLAEIVCKIKAANTLVQRNKSLELNQEQQLFYFPILLFTQNANHSKFIKDRKQLKILLKSKANFVADLDIVKKLYNETIDLKYLIDECENLYT
ncbi:unnamed protein product [Paramecium octaurelia]|uniref:E2F/DP family winged-helix DNA-binding domain-containing protein n=1 Tax=Paramecium octaurelia TaxID=43137 RepID=A0A8S1V9N5_PAROT|nr:unnamed protein product [Paramecium octaurelia]